MESSLETRSEGSGSSMEHRADVETDSVSVCSGGPDWVLISGLGDAPLRNTEGDGGIGEEGEMTMMGGGMKDQTEEEGALEVRSGAAEESHVRIPLEEVESFYRLSRRCGWLCGRFMTTRLSSSLLFVLLL